MIHQFSWRSMLNLNHFKPCYILGDFVATTCFRLPMFALMLLIQMDVSAGSNQQDYDEGNEFKEKSRFVIVEGHKRMDERNKRSDARS